jgi:Fur family transcriptional regulator, peroxide stress response regulator
MNYTDTMIARFKESGLKITPQRMAVVKLLDGNRSHPTAEEIYHSLKDEYTNLSFTTVYNILKSIRDLGGVRELLIDRERAHYDPDTTLHHHIICTRCGRLEDVHFETSAEPDMPADIRKDFRVTGHQINFSGVCRDCGD